MQLALAHKQWHVVKIGVGMEASGEVDEPHAYRMLTESKPLHNHGVGGRLGLLLIIGSGLRTCANMHGWKGLIFHEKSKLTYNFNCLITCHI